MSDIEQQLYHILYTAFEYIKEHNPRKVRITKVFIIDAFENVHHELIEFIDYKAIN